MPLEVIQYPVLEDNYNFVLHERESGVTALIDPSEPEPALAVLEAEGWQLDCILNTHHHWDHTDANAALKEETGCQILGNAADAERIPAIDVGVKTGEAVQLGHSVFEVWDMPGHTVGHIAYYCREEGKMFIGDTLFAMGCGRLFEGTPQQMFDSLQKLRDLPDATLIFCAHEYTQANGAFALSVEPENAALQARMREVQALRAAGKATVPTTMGVERATNPFLRTGSPEIQRNLGMEGAAEVDIFATLRQRKDHFKP